MNFIKNMRHILNLYIPLNVGYVAERIHIFFD